MTVAIYYRCVKDPQNPQNIFGLQVAVGDLVSSFLKYSRQEKFPFLVSIKQALDEVYDYAERAGIDKSRIEAIDARFPQANLEHYSNVFKADPQVHNLLWQRERLKGNGFSYCGIAHAIAGVEAGEILDDYCLDPSTSSDAIICPSRAIKSVIEAYWDNYADYLNARFGASYKCPVKLPVIPLGIDQDRFKYLCTPDKRKDQRAKLGFTDDDVAVLWVGRLSLMNKAHPIGLLQSFQKAAQQSKKRLHLLVYGYFYPQEGEAAFKNLAKDICPDADVQFIQNKDERFPDGLWAGSDIFFSPIDNMQESFGLTPIEAIAAGLPRVLSDWDGYRDSVTHGQDGFLIPTITPPSGQGHDLAALVLADKESFGGYLAKTAMSVAIDTDAAGLALARLADDPDLRKKMAEAARKRLPDYHWKNVIAAYENLWDALHQERLATQTAATKKTWPSVLPTVPDPFTMYASFPSRALQKTDRLVIGATQEEIKKLFAHECNLMALDVMPPPDSILPLIKQISSLASPTVEEIIAANPELDEPSLWRALVWLMKLGIARLA